MSYQYTTRDGQRVEVNVAAAFDKMAAAFKRDTGCTLHVRSGTRTTAEQETIFRQRYVTAGNVRGRRVYDTRRWNGVLWYRVSAAGTVAVPKTSPHEEDGPVGPRALDLYDSGADAGVTTRGTTRDRWMERNAHTYGFANDGYGFAEPWHKRFTGAIGSGGGGGSKAPGFNERIYQQQVWLISRGYDLGPHGADGLRGMRTIIATKKYQEFLRAYGYTGRIDGDWQGGTQKAHEKFYAAVNKPAAPKPSTPAKSSGDIYNPFGISSAKGLQKIARVNGYQGEIDDKWGRGSAAGFAKFLRSGYGYVGNDTLGPKMWAAIARWLRKRWGYVGNDVPGPKMRAALQRANDANFKAL